MEFSHLRFSTLTTAGGRFQYTALDGGEVHRNVFGILVRGGNAPLSSEAKKIVKIWLRNGALCSII